jgi:hypothetical protein
MSDEQRKSGWLARRRERQRVKRERTGDTPEKRAERSRGTEPTVKDAANRVGLGGFLAGGV